MAGSLLALCRDGVLCRAGRLLYGVHGTKPEPFGNPRDAKPARRGGLSDDAVPSHEIADLYAGVHGSVLSD